MKSYFPVFLKMKNAILVPKKRNEYDIVGSMKTFVTDGRPDEGNLKGPSSDQRRYLLK